MQNAAWLMCFYRSIVLGMMTSSNGNIFRVTGITLVSGEFPAQRPVTRSFDVFFDLRLDERLSKNSWGWWLETPSRPLLRQSNGLCKYDIVAWWRHMTSSISVNIGSGDGLSPIGHQAFT